MRTPLIVIIISLCPVLNAQSFDWVRTMGGNSFDQGMCIAVDDSGYAYSAGFFYDSADFSSNLNPMVLISAGSRDGFLTKHNSTGNLVWVKQIKGSSSIIPYDIITSDSCYVYSTGIFAYTADFDPGPAVFNLTNTMGGYDSYIQKLDHQGKLIWAFSLNCSSYNKTLSIELDDEENVYITGYFSGSADFDPDTSQHILTSVNSYDAFVAKYSHQGQLIWAKQLAGGQVKGPQDASQILAFDVEFDGWDILLTGHFDGTVDLDPGSGVTNFTSSGEDDIYVLKMDKSGNLIWAKQFGGPGSDAARCIISGDDKEIYLAGHFHLLVDFDPGPGKAEMNAQTDRDIFILKLDSSGNFIWARQTGFNQTFDDAEEIAMDSQGNLYITGSFSGKSDFDPGFGTYELDASIALDVFILKLNPQGNFEWVAQLGGSGNDECFSIFIDGNDVIYTEGYFETTADFDPLPYATQSETSNGAKDIFIHKGAYLGVGIAEEHRLKNARIFPNPSDGHITIDLGNEVVNEVTMKVIDMRGSLVSIHNYYNTNIIQSYLDLQPGAYMVVLSTPNSEQSSLVLIRK